MCYQMTIINSAKIASGYAQRNNLESLDKNTTIIKLISIDILPLFK